MYDTTVSRPSAGQYPFGLGLLIAATFWNMFGGLMLLSSITPNYGLGVTVWSIAAGIAMVGGIKLSHRKRALAAICLGLFFFGLLAQAGSMAIGFSAELTRSV